MGCSGDNQSVVVHKVGTRAPGPNFLIGIPLSTIPLQELDLKKFNIGA